MKNIKESNSENCVGKNKHTGEDNCGGVVG